MRYQKNQIKETESVGFDYAEVERLLGEVREDLEQDDIEPLARAAHRLIKWVVSGQLRGDVGMRRVARRIIALAWVIDPQLFGESPSLTELAGHIGVGKMLLSTHTSEFSSKFSVRNNHQLLTAGR